MFFRTYFNNIINLYIIKNTLFFSFFFSLLLLTNISLFAITSANKDKKETVSVGYVDIQYILENSSLKEKFSKKYAEQKKKLIQNKSTEQKSLLQLQLSLYKQASFLGYSEYQKKIQTFQNQLSKHKEEINKIQRSLQEWEASNLERLLDSLILALQIISTEYKVDIMLSKEPNIIYSNRKYDFTKKIIQILDNEKSRDEFTAY